MKRVISSIFATLAALYLLLTYRVTPPPVHTIAASADQPDAMETEMTLPADDGAPVEESTTSTTETAPSTTAPPVSALAASPIVQASDATTTSTAKSTTTTVKPTTTTTTRVVTTTTAAPKRTVDGPVVSTDYGPVQVSITVQGTKIVGVKALQAPSGGPSTSINANAVPKLQSETLQAQSANIATVSGATYTSNGWKTSLAAALKTAGI